MKAARPRRRGTPDPLVYLRSADEPLGGLIPLSSARISPRDRGFMLGDGVYEVVRSYRGRLFRPDAHVARLKYSLEALEIRLDASEQLVEKGAELVRRNGLADADATIYIQVTRGVSSRQHAFSDRAVPTTYVETQRLEIDRALTERGITVVTVPDIRWGRCDVKTICLLANVLARQAAVRHGAAEALLVREHRVTEGSHTSVFGIRGDVVSTHPLDGRVLPGITRSAVIGLCRDEGLAVVEAPIGESELGELDEVFVSSTTAEITPVVGINGRAVGSGRPGPVTRRLGLAFRRLLESELGGGAIA